MSKSRAGGKSAQTRQLAVRRRGLPAAQRTGSVLPKRRLRTGGGGAQGAQRSQAATQQRSQAGASQQATTRQQQAQTSRSEAQTLRSESRGTAQQNQDQNREDWQQHQTDRQEDRQDYGQQAQEDRQDFADDQLDEYAHGGGYYYDHDDDWDEAAAFVVGATFTMAAIAAMTSGPQATCAMTLVDAGGIAYYQCGSTWYQKAYTASEVTYVVVAPPPGH